MVPSFREMNMDELKELLVSLDERDPKIYILITIGSLQPKRLGPSASAPRFWKSCRCARLVNR